MTSKPGMTWCPVCGVHGSIVMSTDPITVDFKDGTYVVDGFEYEHCTACGESFFMAGQGDAISAKAAAIARQELGRLTPDEIREVRLSLDMTQGALERALGTSPGMVGRWERGSVLQSATADKLMRIFGAHPELLTEKECMAREARGPYGKSKKA